jgi:hypothetical protein
MLGVVAAPLEWQGWHDAEKLLAPSYGRSGDTLEDIKTSLSGDGMLWAAVDETVRFVAVCQLLKLDSEVQFYVWHCGGDFEGHGRRLLDKAEQWCRQNNIGSMELDGRIGWMRKLQGWKPVSVTMRKELL